MLEDMGLRLRKQHTLYFEKGLPSPKHRMHSQGLATMIRITVALELAVLPCVFLTFILYNSSEQHTIADVGMGHEYADQ